MAEFLFFYLAGPLQNHSKWKTDDTMKTESFRGKIIFI